MKNFAFGVLTALCLCLPLAAQTAPVITTFAGTGNFGFNGDGGAAVLADLASPWGISVDGAGNLYFGDYPGDVTGEFARIRRIDHTTGTISTVAGGGSLPYPNDGELATDVAISSYGIIAVDGNGNFYFDDYDDLGNQLLRRVDAVTHIISTTAGGSAPTGFTFVRTLATNGSYGIEYPSPSAVGDGGLATSAYLGAISDIAIDAAGNIYLAEDIRVRRIDALTHVITTVAGTGEVHPVYLAGLYNYGHEWQEGCGVYSSDGSLATSTGLTHVGGIALDAAGNLYISENGWRQGFVDILPGGSETLVAYTGPLSIAVVNGQTVMIDSATQAVLGAVEDAGGNERLYNLASPAQHQADLIKVSVVRRIDATTGIVTTVAGNADRLTVTSQVNGEFYGEGGPATSAILSGVEGLAIDAAGNLLVADGSSAIRRVDLTTGVITTVAGSGAEGYGGDGGPASLALLKHPYDIAFDGAGNLYVSDYGNSRIRKITGLNPNAPPTANAGIDQSIHASGVVQLDGAASFDDNTPSASLSYSWSLSARPLGSVAVLSNANTAAPTFIADLPGTYVANLVVTDSESLSSTPDQVDISSTNLAPTANAGPDQGSVVNQLVGLNGSASSDPELDPLTFSWNFTQLPMGSAAHLSNGSAVMPYFIPDLAGTYVVGLRVDDDFGPSQVDEVVITVITGQQFAQYTTVQAINTTATLPSTSVTTGGNQQAFSQFLSQSVQGIQSGNLATARLKLQMAISRTDGCALRGTPDTNGSGRDWVTDCSAQLDLYYDLVAALNAITP